MFLLLVFLVPVFLLLGTGLEPQPPSGPVPPIDPPASALCAGLPRGLNCTGGKGGYVICPGGQQETCSEGDQCVQVSPGVIDCKAVPGAACAGKGQPPLGTVVLVFRRLESVMKPFSSSSLLATCARSRSSLGEGVKQGQGQHRAR